VALVGAVAGDAARAAQPLRQVAQGERVVELEQQVAAGADQAGQLRDALLLARCQPAVGAFFNFELLDEDRLAGWQSGVLWRDGTEKPSYGAFRDAVARVRSGRLDCATVPGVAGAPLPPAKPRASSPGIR